jgi:hypothetical protein
MEAHSERGEVSAREVGLLTAGLEVHERSGRPAILPAMRGQERLR